MITLQEISAHNSVCADIQALYESAFPADERRDFAVWLQLLEHEPAFHALAIYQDETFAGLLPALRALSIKPIEALGEE